MLCSAAEAAYPLSIDMHDVEPPDTSACISLSVPYALGYGEELVISATAATGTVNAMAFGIDGGGQFELSDLSECALTSVSFDDVDLSVGTYELTLIDWTDNPSCRLQIEHTLIVSDDEPITELNVSTLPDVAVRGETQLQLAGWMNDGANVIMSVDWGNGNMSSSPCSNASDLSVILFRYTYKIAGTFTVSAIASNAISNVVKDSQMITVYERIRNLTIYGNTTVLVPPGTGVWGVAAGTDQLPLENLVCVWNMATYSGDEVRNVSVLDSSTPHEIAFTYGADVGTQIVHVNCSNTVSSQNLTMAVNVVWDNVTLGALTCNSSTLWNRPVICQLTIVRFGTGACFEWDMGDGKPLVCYQGGYCAVAPTGSPTYVQVPYVSTLAVTTRGQSNLTISALRGPIPRLGVTPGGRNLYH